MTKKKKIIFITSGVVVLGLIVFYFINKSKIINENPIINNIFS